MYFIIILKIFYLFEAMRKRKLATPRTKSFKTEMYKLIRIKNRKIHFLFLDFKRYALIPKEGLKNVSNWS